MRKRSSYRPKPVVTNPMVFLRPAEKTDKDRTLMVFLGAIEAMSRGAYPDPEEWRKLSDAVNTIETLAMNMGKLVPDEVMPMVNKAISAMVRAANRHKAGQRLGLDAEGLQALRAIVDVYAQCLDGLTAAEMAMAQARTQVEVNKLLHSRHSENVVTM